MQVLGLDIGGANLKAAHTAGLAVSRPFALWRNPERLADELRSVIAAMPSAERIALTMTGELCDCFADRRQGVSHILDSIERIHDCSYVDVWTTHGHFVTVHQARHDWQASASANWLALATFAGRIAPPGFSLLVDIGTTTTDILLLHDGFPQPLGRTDRERLRCGELLYRGWRRTPLTTLYPEGAAELFATMHDVCLVLWPHLENPADTDTADGQPATRAAAMRRLARMQGAEIDDAPESEWLAFAEEMLARYRRDMQRCVRRVLSRIPHEPIVAGISSGSGEWLLAGFDLGVDAWVSLNAHFSPEVSAAACAYAVAVLRAEAR
jgi:probable H4MPT-linked C1 transfer pathway protein